MAAGAMVFEEAAGRLVAGCYEAGVAVLNADGWKAEHDGLSDKRVRSLAVNGDTWYAGTDGTGVYRRSGSAPWESVSSGIAEKNVFSLLIDAGTLYAGTNGDGVYMAPTTSMQWEARNAGITGGLVYAMAKQNGKLFAGIGNTGVFMSQDNGQNWTAMNTGLNQRIRSLASFNGKLYAGTASYGAYVSSDDGATWTEMAGTLSGKDIRAFAASGTALFAATLSHGMFMSQDGGGTWTSVSEGLPNSSIYALRVLGDRLYAGVFGAGVWSRPLSQMVVSTSAGPALPEQLRIVDVAPHPIGAQAMLHVSVPVAMHIRATLHDMLGREVATVVEGRMDAGTHALTLRADVLTSGAYMLNVHGLDGTTVRRMVIVR